jgi:hypothetical protein
LTEPLSELTEALTEEPLESSTQDFQEESLEASESSTQDFQEEESLEQSELTEDIPEVSIEELFESIRELLELSLLKIEELSILASHSETILNSVNGELDERSSSRSVESGTAELWENDSENSNSPTGNENFSSDPESHQSTTIKCRFFEHSRSKKFLPEKVKMSNLLYSGGSYPPPPQPINSIFARIYSASPSSATVGQHNLLNVGNIQPIGRYITNIPVRRKVSNRFV